MLNIECHVPFVPPATR